MTKKIKFGIFLILLISISIPAQAEEFENLSIPKRPLYRLGTTYDIEKEYKLTDLTNKKNEVNAHYDKERVKSKTYADSSLKEISAEISQLLSIDKNDIFEDVQILWAGAASKSETIKFAVYKLSNPEADKPTDSVIKKVIKPLSTISSIAGAGLGDPISATTALVTGHLLNSLSFSDKDLNYKYTKITDSDMIVLLNKVENLQRKIIDQYCDYMTLYKMIKMTEANVKKREERYNLLASLSKEESLILDAYYRNALEHKKRLEFEFLSKRAALEQLSGPQAMKEFETSLLKRDRSNKK